MTLSSRHRIRNSSPGGLMPSTLPLGHGGSLQYWLSHVDGEETFLFLWNRRGREPGKESSETPRAKIEICCECHNFNAVSIFAILHFGGYGDNIIWQKSSDRRFNKTCSKSLGGICQDSQLDQSHAQYPVQPALRVPDQLCVKLAGMW